MTSSVTVKDLWQQKIKSVSNKQSSFVRFKQFQDRISAVGAGTYLIAGVKPAEPEITQAHMELYTGGTDVQPNPTRVASLYALRP